MMVDKIIYQYDVMVVKSLFYIVNSSQPTRRKDTKNFLQMGKKTRN
nr:MAG TPA: hypothetical protein [Caudoviricetes sp.]